MDLLTHIQKVEGPTGGDGLEKHLWMILASPAEEGLVSLPPIYTTKSRFEMWVIKADELKGREVPKPTHVQHLLYTDAGGGLLREMWLEYYAPVGSKQLGRFVGLKDGAWPDYEKLEQAELYTVVPGVKEPRKYAALIRLPKVFTSTAGFQALMYRAQ